MPRRKAVNRVPPVTSSRARAGSAWDRTFLGDNRYNTDETPAAPTRTSFFELGASRLQAAQRADDRLYQEIEMALEGDDSQLLPYQPTASIDPKRPRTLAAGYDDRTQTLRIKFRDGDYYTYYNVAPSVWYKFTRASSPGRYINTTLNKHPYVRGLS
jgi:KTSC domain